MKVKLILAVTFLGIVRVRGAEEISDDQFKNIVDENERTHIINDATPDNKSRLKRLEIHRRLLNSWHSEAAIENYRKAAVAGVRGLGALTGLIALKAEVWDTFIAATVLKNPTAGNVHQRERQEIDKLEPDLIDLVFRVARSPEALALNAKAEALAKLLKSELINSGARPLMTEERRAAIDKEIQLLIEGIPMLPKLTTEQAKAEYEALPEDRLRSSRLE